MVTLRQIFVNNMVSLTAICGQFKGLDLFFSCLGSTINSSFNSVRMLHVQDDPAYNPYFALNNQSGVLYSKTPINHTQVLLRLKY